MAAVLPAGLIPQHTRAGNRCCLLTLATQTWCAGGLSFPPMRYPEAADRSFLDTGLMRQLFADTTQYFRERVVIEFKQSRALDGTCYCDVCRWVPRVRLHGGWTIYHGHHVVPVCWSGSLDRSNLALLCPTCHTLAHFLFPRIRKRGAAKVWTGPATPAELVERMRAALGLNAA